MATQQQAGGPGIGAHEKRKMEVESSGLKTQRMESGTIMNRPNLEFPISNEFLLTLCKTPVENLVPSLTKQIQMISREENLHTLLSRLTDYNLLSLPVMKKHNKYFGFVDMLDIVNFALTKFDEKLLQTSWLDSFKRQEDFASTKVNDIMNWPTSRKNPFHPFHKGFSLFSVVEVLAREGIHRVPIVDPSNDQIISIVTQSTVCAFMLENAHLLGRKKDMPVSSMSCVGRPIVTITSEKRAYEGFKLMSQFNISGLAVVDSAGKIVGNISASDLKRIASDASRALALFQPLTVWCQTPPICVKKNATFFEALSIVCRERVHRIYMVDDDNRPIANISLRDFLGETLPI